MQDFFVLVHAYSSAYGVDPHLALALAEAESSLGKQRFRFGRHGNYLLPFGIFVGCKVPRADTLGGNTEAGVKALARHLRKAKGNLYEALKKYNTGDKGAKYDRYYHRVVSLWKANKAGK